MEYAVGKEYLFFLVSMDSDLKRQIKLPDNAYLLVDGGTSVFPITGKTRNAENEAQVETDRLLESSNLDDDTIEQYRTIYEEVKGKYMK